MNFTATVQFLKQESFPLIYSAKSGGIPWICGEVSQAEEFFLRSFPEIVQTILKSKYKDSMYKLLDLGYYFTQQQTENIQQEYDNFRQNSTSCWVPNNLSYYPSSPIDNFLKAYQETFPDKYQRLQEVGQKLDCDMGICARKFLYTDIFYADKPIHYFYTTEDGQEIPEEAII